VVVRRFLACIVLVAAGGCYLRHERPRLPPPPPPGCLGVSAGERTVAISPGTEHVDVVSDGCDRVAVLYDEPTPPLRRAHVALSSDAGDSYAPIFERDFEELSGWRLGLDERGEPLLVTREDRRFVSWTALGEGGTRAAVSEEGEQVAWHGEGGVDNREPHVVFGEPGAGWRMLFWTWSPEESFVAQLSRDAPPRVHAVGPGAFARGCSREGVVAVASVASTTERGQVAVAAADGTPFVAHELGVQSGSTVDVACGRGGVVLAAWAQDGDIRLARADPGTELRPLSTFPGAPAFYPGVEVGPERALVWWTEDMGARARFVVVDLEGEPIGEVRDASDVDPRLTQVREACAFASGFSVLAVEWPSYAAVFHLDVEGAVIGVEPIPIRENGGEPSMSCAREDRVLLGYARDGAVIVNVVPRPS
jgi:hypothetical protein